MKNLRFNRIAFVGQMGAGKDFITGLLPKEWQRVAFGDHIRRCVTMVREGLLVSAIAYLHNNCKIPWAEAERIIDAVRMVPPEPPKDRPALQALGYLVNDYKDGAWINLGIEAARGFEKSAITDLRRPLEFTTLLESGFLIVGVVAPEHVRFKRLEERDGVSYAEFVANSMHRAEKDIESLIAKADVVINNDGQEPFNELKRNVYTKLKQGGVNL